jgi:hypothetical protein
MKKNPLIPPKKPRDKPLKRPSPSGHAEPAAVPSRTHAEKPVAFGSAPPERPRDEPPKHPLGGIVLAPELPEGFKADVRDLGAEGRAAGVDVAGTIVILSSAQKLAEGRLAGVYVGKEDRFLPNDAYKITAYKGYINGASGAWTSRGYRVEHKEIPELDSIDPNKPIRARITFRRDDHRIEVGHLIYFTDRGFHISITADHDDDFKMLSKWAESIRPK